jgi:hypothetical protein
MGASFKDIIFAIKVDIRKEGTTPVKKNWVILHKKKTHVQNQFLGLTRSRTFVEYLPSAISIEPPLLSRLCAFCLLTICYPRSSSVSMAHRTLKAPTAGQTFLSPRDVQ